MKRTNVGGAVAMALAACVTLTACGPKASTQPEPAAKAPPDLSGVWAVANESLDGRAYRSQQPDLPLHQGTQAAKELESLLTSPYLERYRAAQAQEKAGKIIDPTASCMPQGMPRFMYGPFAMEILQTPAQINFFSEWNEQTRRIYTDGRGHPEDFGPAYNGHSIGRWEGDTLVVDTVGIHPDSMLQAVGMDHSAKLHITERFRFVPPDELHVEMMLEDPEALVRPWTGTVMYRKKTDIEIMEYICHENNRDG